MTKVLVLYYSSYGHIETLAAAIAEGARNELAGARYQGKRIAETAMKLSSRGPTREESLVHAT